LPGFRPGKVPMPVLKQRFGSSVRGRVMQNAVNDTTFQVINERGLRAAGQPRIEITKGAEGEDVEYSLAIELMPDIRPMDFKTLELERLVVEISDKEVNEALERFAAGQKRSQPVAAPRAAKSWAPMPRSPASRTRSSATCPAKASPSTSPSRRAIRIPRSPARPPGSP
jgi:trigger factor